MKPIRPLIFLFLPIFISGLVHAGSKGFDVLIVNIGDMKFFESTHYKYYVENIQINHPGSCWSAMRLGDQSSGIAHITTEKVTNKNIELINKIWNGDRGAIQIARKKIRVDDGYTASGEGYHGMYIIKPEGSKLTIMGVGANEDPKRGLSGISPKITVMLDQSKPEQGAKTFEQALCKVSKPFNIGFGV
jgi:hypothetical protein